MRDTYSRSLSLTSSLSVTCTFSNLIFNLTLFFFFFNDTATTEIYTLSLHDALPICIMRFKCSVTLLPLPSLPLNKVRCMRSEEHTSELQSRRDLVCRLLLEKKKKKIYQSTNKI